MFLRTTSQSTLIALIACYHIGGGAGTTPSTFSIAHANAQTQTLSEAFDPSSIVEDLLLIQPNFSRPQLQPGLPSPPQPIEEPTVGNPAEPPGADQPAQRNTTVYRVQLLALSNRDLAQQLRDELAASLNIPMYVQERNQLYVLQAGDYTTRSEARYLLNRVKELSVDYSDAYVISVEMTPENPEEIKEIAEDRPVVSSEEVPNNDVSAHIGEQVRTFGWRVLLDQFLSLEEADRLRSKAIARLNRRDVDVTFKAPWYKVEVGHFSEENEAQSAAEEIKRRYPNALKVRSQVLLPRPD